MASVETPQRIATSVADPPCDRATCAAVMASGVSPNAFEKRSRIIGPPTETWIT